MGLLDSFLSAVSTDKIEGAINDAINTAESNVSKIIETVEGSVQQAEGSISHVGDSAQKLADGINTVDDRLSN